MERETDKVVDLLAAEAAAAEKLRMRHLVDLLDKGALDQEIFEAVIHGTVYFLNGAPPSPGLLDEFRVRYKCDLQVFDDGRELLLAARARLPDAVVLGDSPVGFGVCELLPELLVAAFGFTAPHAVIVSDDETLASEFEVLTYPEVTLLKEEDGPEGLLAALGRTLRVERTGAELRTGEQLKEQMGLTKAHAIQQNLLPDTIPSVPGLEIAVYYEPCQEVGGDYYDFIPLPDGRLGVACADVSGKGVAAAMVMVMFRSILRLAAELGRSPDEVMRVTNQLVSKDMLRGMFVTAAYLCIDPKTGTVRLVNAGHMPLILWPSGRKSPVQVQLRGMAVGLVTGERFAAATPPGELLLEKGDLLCLYTDGVVEAEDRERQQFGIQRLLDAIRAAGRVPAQETVDQVIRAVEAFSDGAPPHDDTTLIVLRATGE